MTMVVDIKTAMHKTIFKTYPDKMHNDMMLQWKAHYTKNEVFRYGFFQ